VLLGVGDREEHERPALGAQIAGATKRRQSRVEIAARFENLSDVDEAAVLAELLDEYDAPAWLSYTIADGRTRAGQSLEEAFAVAAGIDAIIATGVNCCAPADVLAAVESAVAASGKPAIAYPNAGETWDADNHEWVGTSSYDLALVPAWRAAGAEHLGGCCRIGPATIAALAALG